MNATNDNSKRTLTSVLQSLAELGVDTNQYMESIESTCRQAMEVYLPFIKQSFIGCQSEEGIKAPPVGKAFLILGLDVLVDQNMKAWLLEINDNPSLYIYLEKDFMGGGVDKEISPVDLEVKSKVVTDAILLAKRNSSAGWPENFRSFNHLAGLDGESDSVVLESAKALQQLFHEITPIKNKKNMGTSALNKLAGKPFLQGGLLSKVELTQLFTQHITQSKCS